MKSFTKFFCALALCVLGVMSANAKVEQVHADFTNASPTGQATWDGSTKTFGWKATWDNQLKNLQLPKGDISKYKKLVVDITMVQGDRIRVLFYKGGSNKTLYAKDGVNEFIIKDELEAIAPNDYNEYILACDEVCLSGDNAQSPGSCIVNEVYMETYPENEQVDIPEIQYEEDPGMPEGDFVNFTEAFPDLKPRIGLGEDGHPIVLGNGEVVVGNRSKDVIADLADYSKITFVTSPNLKLVLYMNHEVNAQQNAGDYAEGDAGKYVFLDVQADENGIAEVDLTQYAKQNLNCICLPWDNNNKGTVWYILLTKNTAPADPLKQFKTDLQAAIDAAKLVSAVGKTEESFAALQAAIAAAETALAAEDATEESLTEAKNAVTAAVDDIDLAVGYSYLTSDMFFDWSNPEAPVALNLATVLNVATAQPYGDPSVKYFNYADISDYSKLIVAVADGTPRIMLNRAEPLEEGAEGYDPNGSTYVQITDAPVNGIVEVDLTQYEFAHLNAIKANGWGSTVTVTDLLLYKTPVADGIETVKAAQQADAIYNIAGQRVEKAQKGLYIIGGRKVIVK